MRLTINIILQLKFTNCFVLKDIGARLKMKEELDTQLENIEINAIIRNKTQVFNAPVISISQKGLKFTSQDIFSIGEKINLELQLDLGKITSILKVKAKIINMQENEDDNLYTDYEVKYRLFGKTKYSKRHTEN
jgi:hypothetical protein